MTVQPQINSDLAGCSEHHNADRDWRVQILCCASLRHDSADAPLRMTALRCVCHPERSLVSARRSRRTCRLQLLTTPRQIRIYLSEKHTLTQQPPCRRRRHGGCCDGFQISQTHFLKNPRYSSNTLNSISPEQTGRRLPLALMGSKTNRSFAAVSTRAGSTSYSGPNTISR